MKRYLIIAFILLIGQAAQSQELGRLSIGLDFSPSYSNFIFSSNDEFIEEHVNDMGKPRFGFSLGIPVTFNINEMISIETGMHWTKRAFSFDRKYGNLIDPNNGDSIFLIRIDENINYHYIGIPIFFKLGFYKLNKFKLYLKTGFAIDFLVLWSENNYIYYTDHVDNFRGRADRPYNSLKIVNYVVIGGLGGSYELTDKISIKFNPCFSYVLNNRTNDNAENPTEYNFHLYDIAFKIGLNYKFQNKQHPTSVQTPL